MFGKTIPLLRPVSIAAALVLPMQAGAADEGAQFDCNRLNNSIAEIFTGIAEPQPVMAGSAELDEGAVLVTDQRKLAYKKYRIANDLMAARKKSDNPTVFREYMVAAEIRFCTPEMRKDLVRAYKGRFRMHCLVDADGDEIYEAIVPVGQIVRYNRLTGANVGKTYPQPAPTILSSPVTLVEDADLAVPEADLQPAVNIRYAFGETDGDTATIAVNSAVSMLPGEDRFFDWADRARISVSRVETGPQSARGLTVELAQDEGGTARITGYAPPPVTLQCDGTIIALPDSFTLLYPDGQAVLKR